MTGGSDYLLRVEVENAGDFERIHKEILAKLPGVLRIRAGSLQGEVASRPGWHIYADSKANWWELDDDLPRYAERKE